MAKVKVKVNGQAIKNFFVQNGEKVGMGIAGVLTCFLLLKAFSQPGQNPQNSPGRLATVIVDAKNHMLTKTPPPAPKFPPIDTQLVTAGIDGGGLKQLALPFIPPKIQRAKREQPQVVTVDELTASGGHGSFALKGVGPGAQAVYESRHFMMLTGLVPIDAQQQEYDKRFKNAEQPSKDKDPEGDARKLDRMRPKYYLYDVKRREVLPNGTFGPETKVDLQKVWLDWKRGWAAPVAEIVPKQYLDERLTMGLPPLQDKSWDLKQVSHQGLERTVEAEKPAGRQAVKADAADSVFGAAVENPGAVAIVNDTREKLPPYKLYRFWDYNVEPGKSYQYSVQLKLHNPNWKLDARYLQDPALADEEYLLTDWSKWSVQAMVPLDHHLYVKGTVFNGGQKETVAQVLCVSWDAKSGKEISGVFELSRGQMAQFTDSKGSAFSPNMLLVDIRGGQVSPGKNAGPAELTFLDPRSGRLVVRREEDDREMVKQFEPPPAAADAKADPGPMGLAPPGAMPFNPLLPPGVVQPGPAITPMPQPSGMTPAGRATPGMRGMPMRGGMGTMRGGMAPAGGTPPGFSPGFGGPGMGGMQPGFGGGAAPGFGGAPGGGNGGAGFRN